MLKNPVEIMDENWSQTGLGPGEFVPKVCGDTAAWVLSAGMSLFLKWNDPGSEHVANGNQRVPGHQFGAKAGICLSKVKEISISRLCWAE